MRYIPQDCPRCGYVHWLQVNRLSLQMRCKGCNAEFYVDSTGQCRLGKRPETMEDPLKFGPVSNQIGGKADPLGWIEKMPPGLRAVVLGTIFLTFALGAYYGLNQTAEPISPELMDRAEYAGLAFAQGDQKRFLRISEGDRDDVAALFRKARPKAWLDWNEETQPYIRFEKNAEKNLLRLMWSLPLPRRK